MTEKNDVDLKLKQIVENIEKIDADIKILTDEKSEILKNAKVQGFDSKVIKKVIALRKLETQERLDLESMTETYKKALGMITNEE